MEKKFYLFLFITLSVLTAKAWDGEGTKSSPYLIKTKADFLTSSLKNTYFITN